MRSPVPRPGRKNFFESLWQFLTGFQRTQFAGSQRPRATLHGVARRNYDLEIREKPVRDPQTAREICEIMTWCYEARHSLAYIARDCFASSDGDDIGWTIADTLDDQETPIDPDVRVILLDLLHRRNGSQFILGGNRLKRAVRETVGYGDCFVELAIEKDGKDYGISNTLYLPAWEMFRKETDQGELQGFEQRVSLSDTNPVQLHPLKVVHWRYEPQALYGMSVFHQSLKTWAKLKDATFDLSKAARSLGCDPNIHIMPPEWSIEQKLAYQEDYIQGQADGILTDCFILSGADIKKLGNTPQLQGLIDYVLHLRYQVIPPGFPVWLFPGLNVTGAKDIANQPAMAYSRFRNDICSTMTEGIRQACDIELILKLGMDEFVRRGHYRIIWPKFSVATTGNMMMATGEDPNEEPQDGMEDLDYRRLVGNGKYR